ncbi:MAG: hypothetical protein KDN19_17045 [Verrucomicrobiae bacterium]|nr:hypothetical protein [Verrucomicrobiae bacterium]
MRSSGRVTTLIVSSRARFRSRLGFYAGVMLMLWVMGRLDEARSRPVAWTDEELGVAIPYIASPVVPNLATLPGGR